MYYNVDMKIIEVLVPAGITPTGAGVVLSSKNTLRITSRCCGNFVWYIYDDKKYTNTLRCVECGNRKPVIVNNKTPLSPMRSLGTVSSPVSGAIFWVAGWMNVPEEDVEIAYIPADT